jgi:hypothetical protein
MSARGFNMKFLIEIEMGNEAMLTRNDLERAMVRLANLKNMSDPPEDGDGGFIYDINGNRAGKWEISA